MRINLKINFVIENDAFFELSAHTNEKWVVKSFFSRIKNSSISMDIMAGHTSGMNYDERGAIFYNHDERISYSVKLIFCLYKKNL